MLKAPYSSVANNLIKIMALLFLIAAYNYLVAFEYNF